MLMVCLTQTKMTSEIIKEINQNHKDMQRLISNQAFRVSDAQKFLERYYNVVRKVEDLEASRDHHKIRGDMLKKELGELKIKLKETSIENDLKEILKLDSQSTTKVKGEGK